ncbi:MAG: HD domain-containing phosphohydrolase [Nitrospiraceae bacterium]
MGQLHEKLTQEVATGRELNTNLQQQQEELRQANTALQDYSESLSALNRNLQVQQDELSKANATLTERTEELEQSKRSIEALKAKVEETLYATMDFSVVNMIIEGRLRNEKRTVSIMFTDLAGFSSYSEEKPPEVVIRELNRFIGDMEPLLMAYRGHIDKYMGDGIMCEFGAPLECETHRLLAVLAGIKAQEKMAKLNYPWKLRVGIGTGPMITGLIGSKRQTFTAIGDVVNIASRLEQACAPEHVLIDRDTYNGINHLVEARKKRDLPSKDGFNPDKEQELEGLHEQTARRPDDAKLYFRIGEIHLELNEPVEALLYFERALDLDKGNKDFKVAYAEAGMKMRELEKISVKGKRQRVEAFEVIGIKDILLNREKIPQNFYQEFAPAADLITIPYDLVLPVEALDGSLGHSKVVALVSYAIANAFGLPDKDKLDILHAGFMADIGKEIIPHYILNRGGSLSKGEFDMVRMHTSEGVRIMRKMGYENEALLQVVLHSHENFSGTGYPNGLKGEDIPLGARIVAVADAYDALTSKRPYRDSWERHAALDEIGRGVETGLYDPKVVTALERIMS